MILQQKAMVRERSDISSAATRIVHQHAKQLPVPVSELVVEDTAPMLYVQYSKLYYVPVQT